MLQYIQHLICISYQNPKNFSVDGSTLRHTDVSFLLIRPIITAFGFSKKKVVRITKTKKGSHDY